MVRGSGPLTWFESFFAVECRAKKVSSSQIPQAVSATAHGVCLLLSVLFEKIGLTPPGEVAGSALSLA
jgi:hypothetical protein